ncbi:SDR family oxidoreductase [Granulicella sibirica]|uniref:UDP-glucose 4-epimerase n=1 Tax=Granulicella sibirica TaxID=2479048 RepID=A0A4Q0T769_9BACT|nr:SDR family oxidoreductase [Granulicella sibirica]RXH58540.1 UDP-glucose 4-epimerase [Granulicella sibirica]
MAVMLVTGIAGFIGSHLADALVQQGHEVRGLDNFATGSRRNLAGVADRIDVRVVDLRDEERVAEACEGVDTIFHEGALPSVPRSVKEPRPSHETNIDGTFNLLEGARLAGVKRIVYAASSSAYGDQPGFPRVETMAPKPLSPYAVQKLTCELYLQSYWQVYGIETVCLRYFNIFGPRQVPDSPYSGVMARFILQMMRGEQPVIFGDGEQGRDFTYIANVVQANLLAASALAEKVAGRVFNVACGERHTLNETFGLLAGLLNYARGPKYGPERAGDVRDSLADISAAREAFGYAPELGFEEGLRRTVAWYKTQTEMELTH